MPFGLYGTQGANNESDLAEGNGCFLKRDEAQEPPDKRKSRDQHHDNLASIRVENYFLMFCAK
jgi:hypothetical protein